MGIHEGSSAPDLNRLREEARKVKSSLTQERKGEIALLLLKNQLRSKGLHLSSMKRTLGNEAHETGVPVEELMSLLESVTRELVDEAFLINKES